MKIRIREDVTPENAKSLGFEWYKDIIYDEEAPKETMAEIVKMIKSGKWILGKCATIGHVENMYGLYKK